MSDVTPTADLPIDRQVRYELTDNGVAWITLDRPDVANAISPDQRDRVIELLDDAGRLLAIRCVVITATGKAFCTGADLRAKRAQDPRPEGAPDQPVGFVSRMIATGAQAMIGAVLDCPKPVIAAVNGTAAGIGAHLAFACDLVVAAEDARFIEVFVRRALVPDGGGAYLLPRLIGLQRAKELLFLGDDVSAAAARDLGLVNRVVATDEVAAEAGALADRLAGGPTQALALTKMLCNRSLDSDRATAFHEEAWAQEANMGTYDAQEGVRSFIERRSAEYRGW
ncbi:MAG TPA: enoyl-CoA hydratase-related protein [Acidimicrobiales bacterium]|nr:enoyl-CoA hydratase-related protein [Acidimicrobiales bacterium]